MKKRTIVFICGLICVSISGHALLLAVDVIYSMIICSHQTTYFDFPATIFTLATALLAIPCSIYGWRKCFNINTKNPKPDRINIKYINTVAILLLLLLGTGITKPRKFNTEYVYAFWGSTAIAVYLNKKHYQ
jgi:hypothetical protein